MAVKAGLLLGAVIEKICGLNAQASQIPAGIKHGRCSTINIAVIVRLSAFFAINLPTQAWCSDHMRYQGTL